MNTFLIKFIACCVSIFTAMIDLFIGGFFIMLSLNIHLVISVILCIVTCVYILYDLVISYKDMLDRLKNI